MYMYSGNLSFFYKQRGDTICGPDFTVEDVDDNFHTWSITGGTGM